MVSKIEIEVHETLKQGNDLKELAQNLIRLKKGDMFSSHLLEESIDALRHSERFQHIHVESQEEEGEIALFFSLTPFRLIKDIKIRGAFPLFEHEILNVMTIYVSDALVVEELAKQADLIEELLLSEGFVDPEINVKAVEDPKDGNYTILVKIEKGDYHVLKELRFRGNRAFTDNVLKWKMKTWRVTYFPGSSRRFTDGNFRKDVENLIAFYRKNGYPDVTVDFTLNKDPNHRSVSAQMNIQEGSFYRVTVEGNSHIRTRILRKEFVLFKEGNRYDQGVRKSAKRITERYHAAGFTEAVINFESEEVHEGEMDVRFINFHVKEGPRSIIRSVLISGNSAIKKREILRKMKTRPKGLFTSGEFIPANLEADIVAIRVLYSASGFPNAEIEAEVKMSEDRQNVSIVVQVQERQKIIISSVHIIGLTTLTEKEVYGALSLQNGSLLKKYLITQDENIISSMAAERGYPYAKARGEIFLREDGTTCDIVYTVTEGPFVKMGEVFLIGNFRTKENILRRELNFEADEPFSLSKVLKAQQNLRNMAIFDSVTFTTIGLAEGWDRAHLFVELVEKKPYFLEFSGGYETDKGVFLHTTAGDHNLFGKNKYGWIGTDISQIGYRAELGFSEPRFFGSHISANLSAYAERLEEFNQIFGTKSLGAALGFYWSQARHLSMGINFRVERREQFSTVPEAAPMSITEPRSILGVTPVLTYDTRDSFLYPKEGVFSLLSVDLSKGIENSFDDYIKYRLEQRAYFSPFHPLTLAVVGRFGYIMPYGPVGRVPEDRLFFLGGMADVRGFKENLLFSTSEGNPVGGLVALSGSLEARIDLGHNLELSLFYDTGVLGDSFGDVSIGHFRSSAGVGMKYRTPVGPIGLLYGINLAPKAEEAGSRVHFSMGYTF